MKEHTCINCGQLQGYIGAISSYIYCERCGAKIYADGSVSYDGTSDGLQQQQDNIDFHDSEFSDRVKYLAFKK